MNLTDQIRIFPTKEKTEEGRLGAPKRIYRVNGNGVKGSIVSEINPLQNLFIEGENLFIENEEGTRNRNTRMENACM